MKIPNTEVWNRCTVFTTYKLSFSSSYSEHFSPVIGFISYPNKMFWDTMALIAGDGKRTTYVGVYIPLKPLY